MTNNNRLLTLTNTYTSTYRILGSKFYGFAFPSASISAFDQELSDIKKAYPDASHHCYAWRMNPNQPEEFSQDDGEPSGTAGLPILNVLKSAHLCNCGIVVVRYFGGTKLGKSGLIDAYGATASLAFEEAKPVSVTPAYAYSIQFDYTHKRAIDNLVIQYHGVVNEATFLETVSYTVYIPAKDELPFYDELTKLEWLGIKFQKKGEALISGL